MVNDGIIQVFKPLINQSSSIVSSSKSRVLPKGVN